MVAAWNEEEAIEATLERVAATSYPGRVAVVLADNNSTDRSAEFAEAAALCLGLDYRRVFEPEPGKFHALNRVMEGSSPGPCLRGAADALHRHHWSGQHCSQSQAHV